MTDKKELPQSTEELNFRVMRLLGKRPVIMPQNRRPLAPFSEMPERRIKLAEKLKADLTKSETAIPNNRLSLPETERPAFTQVLRHGILGLIDDDVLIEDMLPQVFPEPRRTKPKDPDILWGPVFSILTEQESTRLTAVFRALRRFHYGINSDFAHGQARKNTLMRESLQPEENANFDTVGDLRKLSKTTWSEIPGIGPIPAQIMIEAFKKTETA